MRHKTISVKDYPSVRSKYEGKWYGIILNVDDSNNTSVWEKARKIATCLIILDQKGNKMKNRVVKKLSMMWLDPIPNLDEQVYKSWLKLDENGR